MKEKLNIMGKHIARTLSYFLAAVAGVAISWVTIASFDALNTWYTLPIMALFTGVVTALVPSWGNRFTPVYAVSSAGLALLLIHVVANSVSPDSFIGIVYKFAIIVGIGLLSDVILSKDRPSFGDILLDVIICCIAALLSIEYLSAMIIPVIIIAYILVLTIQVKPGLRK